MKYIAFSSSLFLCEKCNKENNNACIYKNSYMIGEINSVFENKCDRCNERRIQD